MDIILSKFFGPCYGVSTAFEKCMKIDSNVKILGDIAHNKILINKLKSKKNIKIVKSVSEIDEHDSVVIRTHGITIEEMNDINKKKCKIIDQTCCNVRFVQKIAEDVENRKKTLILVGNKLHPEVIGISSRCNRTLIVDSLESTKNLVSRVNLNSECLVVASQTTFDHEKFFDICNFLKMKFNNIKIYNTICNDSFKRRKEIMDVSNFIDYCMVIGDKNSSNSTKLFEFSKKFCRSYMIENPENLDVSILNGVDRIFITSGASVLKDTVFELVNNIKKIKRIKIKKVV